MRMPFEKTGDRQESIKTPATPRAGCRVCGRDIVGEDADYYLFRMRGAGAGHTVPYKADYVGTTAVRLHFLKHEGIEPIAS